MDAIVKIAAAAALVLGLTAIISCGPDPFQVRSDEIPCDGRQPEICGQVFPRDCPDPKNHCWPPYGCLNLAQTIPSCSWIHTGREEVTSTVIRLTTASGRVPSIDETENNEMVGLRVMASLRVVEFLVGTAVYKEVFGASASGGFSDTGYGKYSEMGAISRAVTSGTAQYVTVPDVCSFTVYGTSGIRLYQAYGRVVIRRDAMESLVESTKKEVKNVEVEAQKPELKRKAKKLLEALEKDFVKKLESRP